MNKHGKATSLALLLLLVATSTVMVKPTSAQSIPKPSVPEFTLSLVGPPYVVPTTYHLDESTGQIVADTGYTNQYNSVVITIKNQPYGTTYGSLYYNIRVKNHDWTDSWIYPLDNLFSMFQTYPPQSTDSDYTNITLPIQSTLLVGVQNDIQVEAMLGNIGRHQQYSDTGQYLGAPYVFNGQTSDWSSTQTISIPANVPLSPAPAPSSSPLPSSPTPSPSVSPTPNPTETPCQLVSGNSVFFGLNWVEVVIVALLAVIVVLLVFVVVYLRRRSVG